MAKILLVDDEPRIVTMLSKRLQHAGYDVAVAADGEAGVAMAREIRPALIVLDLLLPKMNGYEVCAELRKDKLMEHTPIIMFSCKEATHEQFAGLMFGANVFIPKTSGSDAPLEQISELLGRPLGDKV